MAKVLKEMPRDLRLLLSAEIFIRWGDWFARDFAVLYIVNLLVTRWGWAEPAAARNAGYLLGIMGITALATYVPIAKWVDRSPSPRPFIGTTFLMFSLFPICLVLLPKICAHAGLPVMAGLVLAYVINGLREVGEPARKALIASGFPPEVRARAVGLYWGLRSFAFCPAPIVAALLWHRIGPDYTFLIGGGIGLLGTLWYQQISGPAIQKRGEASKLASDHCPWRACGWPLRAWRWAAARRVRPPKRPWSFIITGPRRRPSRQRKRYSRPSIRTSKSCARKTMPSPNMRKVTDLGKIRRYRVHRRLFHHPAGNVSQVCRFLDQLRA